MQLPWRSFGDLDKNRDYEVLLSYLPLRHYRTLGRFVLYTLRVMRQLRFTPGLAGYSLDAKILRGRFWTLSVWESDEALAAFVAAQPHAEVMRLLAGSLDKPGFIQWKVQGADLPLSWADAHAREARQAQIDER